VPIGGLDEYRIGPGADRRDAPLRSWEDRAVTSACHVNNNGALNSFAGPRWAAGLHPFRPGCSGHDLFRHPDVQRLNLTRFHGPGKYERPRW